MDISSAELADLLADGASWTTQPSGGGLRNGVKRSRQLQVILAHAALVPAFLHGLTKIKHCSASIHSCNFGD
jgi:hypothetical protein